MSDITDDEVLEAIGAIKLAAHPTRGELYEVEREALMRAADLIRRLRLAATQAQTEMVDWRERHYATSLENARLEITATQAREESLEEAIQVLNKENYARLQRYNELIKNGASATITSIALGKQQAFSDAVAIIIESKVPPIFTTRIRDGKKAMTDYAFAFVILIAGLVGVFGFMLPMAIDCWKEALRK